MATITFEDGTKVNFQGTPTQKDVEEVASQIKLKGATAPSAGLPPKPSVGKITSAVGGAAEGLGAKLPLMAIDYVGKKLVDKFGSEQSKQNLASAPSLTEKYDQTFGKKENPMSYGAGNVAGTVGGLVVPVKQGITALRATPTIAAKIAAKDTAKLGDTAGTIIQGEIGDIPRAQKALSQIDVKGIKTYKDLETTLNNKIGQASSLLDTTLDTSPITKKLGDLTHTIKVGAENVQHNYAEDAIKQLKDFYLKTNNVEKFAEVNQLANKAKTEGLTIKEINNLARQHGQELNAFNANGELASGLTKQAAENTRSGLKSTARDLFGDKIYKTADEGLSDLIRTRKLVADMADKVNDLRQKVQTRGVGERAGRLIGQFINTVGLNSPKGLVEYFLGRGSGLKTLNALDLEKNLASNLKQLQKLTEGSEDDIIRKLEAFLGKGGLPPKPNLPVKPSGKDFLPGAGAVGNIIKND